MQRRQNLHTSLEFGNKLDVFYFKILAQWETSSIIVIIKFLETGEEIKEEI